MILRDFFDIFRHFSALLSSTFSTLWTYNKRDFDLFIMDGCVSGGVARGDENSTFRYRKIEFWAKTPKKYPIIRQKNAKIYQKNLSKSPLLSA